MKYESRLKTARIVSVIAATLIALASGTNYIYSAWGPQFAERLKLSATQNNLIGACGNLGMYAGGIPVGILIDHKGPRWGLLLGAILLAAGYYPIKLAYDAGAGHYPIPALCFFSVCTGVGSCSAFGAALKTAALNYPENRGTATAFPLSGFGLSAFFFSLLSRLAFPGDTSRFLLLLATGTVVLVVISGSFLRVIPHSPYSSLPTQEPDESTSQVLHRTRSAENKHRLPSDEPGAQSSPNPETGSTGATADPDQKDPVDEGNPEIRGTDTDETSSLLSKSDAGSRRENVESDREHGSLYADIRGLQVLSKVEFWQQFLLMGLLTGVGLMTINNIGNDARALWRHYDDSASNKFITERQVLHVAILSLCSFAGRLFSGIGSDLLVKHLHASRLWCITFSAIIFCIAQICAMNIENPNYLGAVSGTTGFAYGFLFGCFPSLVAHTFGVHTMSQNWGAMTMAPVVTGNLYNLVYGAIYDKHSITQPGGNHECLEGVDCYRPAYAVTLVSAVLGILVTIWGVRTERKHWAARSRGKESFEHERQA